MNPHRKKNKIILSLKLFPQVFICKVQVSIKIDQAYAKTRQCKKNTNRKSKHYKQNQHFQVLEVLSFTEYILKTFKEIKDKIENTGKV